MSLDIRTLDEAGIAQLLSWAGDEGWNPGLADAGAFAAADPNGFFGLFVDNHLVAGISAVAYNATFGFIGLYICHKDHRGKGYGRAVWDHAMAYLGTRTIGLDGVPEQQASYGRMGFVPVYETIRMSGVLPRIQPASGVVPIEDVSQIVALDRACFPAAREAFVERWIASPHRAVRADGGYGVARRCLDGSKLGPIFAEDCDIAKAMLTAFHGPVQIDMPATQTRAIDHLVELGFRPGFTTARMYRGTPPVMSMDRIYGVTSLELG